MTAQIPRSLAAATLVTATELRDHTQAYSHSVPGGARLV